MKIFEIISRSREKPKMPFTELYEFYKKIKNPQTYIVIIEYILDSDTKTYIYTTKKRKNVLAELHNFFMLDSIYFEDSELHEDYLFVAFNCPTKSVSANIKVIGKNSKKLLKKIRKEVF